MPDLKKQALERDVDVSKAVQKRRYEVKGRAWKLYVKARDRFRRRRQITRARVLRLRKYRQAHKEGGAKKAVGWALKQVGTSESPAFSNRGPKIDQWETATLGYSGYSWCQAFANAVLLHGGGEQLKSAYTPQVVDWANANEHGLKRVDTPQVGDFVFFKFPGVSNAFCDHVGVYIGAGSCVEGNTSPASAGSQNNGGTVAIKTRPRSQWAAIVRPTYG
jgi:hypothetical protein